MTVARTASQTGQRQGLSLSVASTTVGIEGTFDQSAWFRFTGYSGPFFFQEYLTLTFTVNSCLSATTLHFHVPADADESSAITNRALVGADIFVAESPNLGLGTARSWLVGAIDIAASGSPRTYELDLEVSMVMAYMTGPGTWNSELSLRAFSKDVAASLVLAAGASAPTLTTADEVAAPNFDTGRDGFVDARSRMGRCPITGLVSPTENWIRDGFRGIMVSPAAYDPPEPPARIWPPEAPDAEE